jgi:hypothetical protein
MATTCGGMRRRIKPPPRHETSRADFARQFGGKSDLFCELINIAQRLNSQKIHVRPTTHQHADADVTIVQMSQSQKNL